MFVDLIFGSSILLSFLFGRGVDLILQLLLQVLLVHLGRDLNA